MSGVEGDASHIEIEAVRAPQASDLGFVEMPGAELLRLQRVARLLVGMGEVADDLVAEAIARTLPIVTGVAVGSRCAVTTSPSTGRRRPSTTVRIRPSATRR